MSNISNTKKVLLAILIFVGLTTHAQIKIPIPSPKATVIQDVGLATVTITYYRPSLNDRNMIGSHLIPYGKVWRTGANKIPSLQTTEELTIAGHKLSPGTYGIFTIPNRDAWTIIISNNPDHYDANSYDQKEDVVQFEAKAQHLGVPVEHFTIAFDDFQENGAAIIMTWEHTQIRIPILNDPDPKIMAEILEKTSKNEVSTATYYNAADYYLNTDRDLTQALEWMDIVIQGDPQYWTYSLRAKIAAKLGKCDLVRSDVKKGKALAQEANDMGYLTLLENTLKSCQ